MDGCPSRLLLHTACGPTSEELVPEAENACCLLLRCWMLHLFEVDARMLQLSLEMPLLRLRVLPEGLRAGSCGDCHYQCEHWFRWQWHGEPACA